MPDVEFSEEEELTASRATGAKTGAPSGGLTGLVVRSGFAKDAKGASFVLLIAALIIVAVAVGVFVSGLP